jgi:taurine transport system ATP-binding protein
VKTYSLGFCKDFIASGDARAVKSKPEFIAMREEILNLIHSTHAESMPV